MKITTCIPKQINDFDLKIKWLEDTLKRTDTNIFITPQEFFGGDYQMPNKRYVTKDEFLPVLEKLSSETSKAIIIGVVEKDGNKNYQRLWFIDGTFKGEITKFALPNYTHSGTGSYDLTPETDWNKRLLTFEIKGIHIAGFFCWEVFSDILFAGLGLLEPDLVISSVKFGIAGYPKLTKDKPKKIESIQYCGGDIWYERLVMASKFELKCPIACSTNSWNEKAKMRPLVGMIYPYKNMEEVKVTDNDLKGDVIITQEMNFQEVRGFREHKFSFLDRTGHFPDWTMSEYTMLFKIHRLEQRHFGKSRHELIDEKFKKLHFNQKKKK